MSAEAKVVSGPVVTRSFKLLGAFMGLGVILALWRFAVGLGPTTGSMPKRGALTAIGTRISAPVCLKQMVTTRCGARAAPHIILA